MLAWLRFIFNEPTQDMSHGWVVPLFSLFLVWRRRREIAAAAGPPSLAGVLLCLPLLALLWLGERGDQPRLSQIAVYGLLWTLPYACFGRCLARRLLFPVAFLVFTVPLGFLDFFTVRLRLATAWISALLAPPMTVEQSRTTNSFFIIFLPMAARPPVTHFPAAQTPTGSHASISFNARKNCLHGVGVGVN